MRSWRGAILGQGILALLVVLAPPASARSPVIDPVALSVEELVTLARQHAPKLQDARAKVALARLDLRGTEWWTWLVPNVTAHQGYDFLTGQERAAVGLRARPVQGPSAKAPARPSAPGSVSPRPSVRSPSRSRR